MSRARASFINPETGQIVGAFFEDCRPDGTALARVRLSAAQTLTGTAQLEVFSTIKDQAVIAVGTDGVAQREIHEFEGTSSLGCLPEDTGVSLVRTPGGDLGTLLIVLGNGTVEPDPAYC